MSAASCGDIGGERVAVAVQVMASARLAVERHGVPLRDVRELAKPRMFYVFARACINQRFARQFPNSRSRIQIPRADCGIFS